MNKFKCEICEDGNAVVAGLACGECGQAGKDNSVNEFLSSEAERSGVLQGCPPSANCSAGAGADARNDSLNSSPVPRETAVFESVDKLVADWRKEAGRRRDDAERERKMGWEGADVEIAYAECLEDKATELERLVARLKNAPHCKGERALARNVDLSRAADKT